MPVPMRVAEVSERVVEGSSPSGSAGPIETPPVRLAVSDHLQMDLAG